MRKVAEERCDEVEEWLSGASDAAAVVNEAADAAGNTALHLAAEKGSLAMVGILVKHGAKLDVANKSSGEVGFVLDAWVSFAGPLICAPRHLCEKILLLLLYNTI